MRTYKEELGKVSLTVNGVWDENVEYDRLCLVRDGAFSAYISRVVVPAGIPLTNLDYWMPLVSFYDEAGEVVLKAVKDAINDGTLQVGVATVETFAELENPFYHRSGNLVYVKDEKKYYSYAATNTWYIVPSIYLGTDEPGEVIWIDPKDDEIIPADADEEFENVKKALVQLQQEIKELQRLQTIGIIPGNVANSYRRILMSIANPEQPDGAPDIKDEEMPDLDPASNTVPCLCCKMDTAANFAANKADLIDGELLFYTDRKRFVVYYGGSFYISGSGSSESGGSGGISLEELYNLNLEKLNFTNGIDNYKVGVDDKGRWVIKQFNENVTKPGTPDDTYKVYISQYLCMNSIYCGGDADENCLCTHNYIELANGSKKDINLNGLYLLYTDGTKDDPADIGYKWKVLALNGVIKAGNTFVIRGARCNTDKEAFIKVDSYDMEWKIDGELIKFNQGPASFYLCVGDSFVELLENKTLNNPWQNSGARNGYIDSCGFGEGSVGEGSSTFLVQDDWNKILFVRWFMLEPAKQGNKNYSSRKTVDLWTYINLEKQTTAFGNSLQYYYPDNIKEKYTPMASYLGKTFFTNKTRFDENHANYINITFGIQATDNGTGATRCFNWVSVGNYDEYVEYRKKGDVSWIRVYSITENNISNPEWITKFIEHYRRFRWTASDGTKVTTHKCIIKNIIAGDYEFRIGRDDNNLYYNDPIDFKVESNEDVKNFKFIHISDQQGFNWQEYTAWWKASYMIKKNELDFNFFINTGDITQSGNRANEWLDYYQGKKYNINKCEMFSIGNNDLCGHVSTELTDGEDATSKYNHINVLRYFCFELDVNNNYSYEWDGNTYPLYSVYSFNYGDYHFVSINSEMAIASSKMYKDWESNTYQGDRTLAENANIAIEDWLKKDLQLWKGNTNDEPTDCSKCIVYMHEMPFTIVTWSFMSGESARAGSHLNTINSRGLYRFSRLFKKYGIRVVMGGHKHTYCVTKPVYDAPDGYITENNIINENIDLMGEVTTSDSRKPVVQVTDISHVIANDNYARYEVVDKLTAPIYIMTQATGYKLVSNKEQPSGPEYTIPWLLSYIKAKTNAASPTENVQQHHPMYISYELGENDIKVTIKQVQNIWDVNVANNSKKFDMNKQLNELVIKPMTLHYASDEDKEKYNITDIDTLTINL